MVQFFSICQSPSLSPRKCPCFTTETIYILPPYHEINHISEGGCLIQHLCFRVRVCFVLALWSFYLKSGRGGWVKLSGYPELKRSIYSELPVACSGGAPHISETKGCPTRSCWCWEVFRSPSGDPGHHSLESNINQDSSSSTPPFSLLFLTCFSFFLLPLLLFCF